MADTGPRKANRGNRRNGALRGRGGRGASLSDPKRNTRWQDDPIIRARMQVVWECWAKGMNRREINRYVNQWAAEHTPENPTYSDWTIREDMKRIMELIDDGDEELRQRHLAALQLVQSKGWEEWDVTNAPMAKPSILNVIRSAIETASKIDGSLIQRVEKQVTITDEKQAMVLVQVLVRHLGSEDKAMLVLEEMKHEIEATPEVISGRIGSH